MKIDLVELRRDLKLHRKTIRVNQRRLKREMRTIKKEIEKIYPQPEILEAVSFLIDSTYDWEGDFNRLRLPLAELLMKVSQAGLFPDDVKRITRILLHNR